MIRRLLALALRRCQRIMAARAPDLVIGPAADPYLRRWFLIPRNRLCNLYLHHIHRSDDDRALHDHPWPNASVMLAGSYVEHMIRAGGIHVRKPRAPGSVVLRRAAAAHRLQLPTGGQAVTLFLTGPRLREWGFHCPEAGWRHWRDYTQPGPLGESLTGRGCE